MLYRDRRVSIKMPSQQKKLYVGEEKSANKGMFYFFKCIPHQGSPPATVCVGGSVVGGWGWKIKGVLLGCSRWGGDLPRLPQKRG